METQLNYEDTEELFIYFSAKKRKHEEQLARLKRDLPNAVNMQKALATKIEFSRKWIDKLRFAAQ